MSDVALALTSGLVGAVLVGGVEFWLRWRGERFERRAIARVVLEELTVVERTLRNAVETPELSAALPKVGELLLPQAEWRSHRLALARLVHEDKDWDTIGAAYATTALAGELPAHVNDPKQVDGELRVAHKCVVEAIAIVERSAGRATNPEQRKPLPE